MAHLKTDQRGEDHETGNESEITDENEDVEKRSEEDGKSADERQRRSRGHLGNGNHSQGAGKLTVHGTCMV